jgi:Rod binding domain-containing protein
MKIDSTPATSLPRPITTESKKDIAQVAKDFEAVFLSSMVNTMLKTVPEGSFGGGQAEQHWKSFLGDAIAKEMTDSSQTGIAQAVETQLKAYEQGMDR